MTRADELRALAAHPFTGPVVDAVVLTPDFTAELADAIEREVRSDLARQVAGHEVRNDEWFHAAHGLHDEAHHQAHRPLDVCVPLWSTDRVLAILAGTDATPEAKECVCPDEAPVHDRACPQFDSDHARSYALSQDPEY